MYQSNKKGFIESFFPLSSFLLSSNCNIVVGIFVIGIIIIIIIIMVGPHHVRSCISGGSHYGRLLSPIRIVIIILIIAIIIVIIFANICITIVISPNLQGT